jgi:hypothetical protein
VKKRTIVIVLAVALLLVLVLAGTAYGTPAPAPMTTGITIGTVLYQQQQNPDGSVAQKWSSWFIIEGVNGKPDRGSITDTDLYIGPGGKILSKATDTEPVSHVSRLNCTTMEFFIPGWGSWVKVVDGGWPGVKKDAWSESKDGTNWYPIPILAGDIIVF